MYVRVSIVRRGPKTYRYAQIVESYRKDGGSPTNRVVASLGQRSEAEIDAMRKVLKIARGGGTAVFEAKDDEQVEVLHSLRYLDVALLLAAWRDSGLETLVADACGSSKASVSTAEVTTALVLQRCLAPGSKLAASRWFPTTALPELQGIAPALFNNSRIHRALVSLEAAETKLQQNLPEHLFKAQGTTAALFLDATDTWFEGQGPPLAAKRKDKRGIFRRCVGIVLLCDVRGFPLRWHTLNGKFHDPSALGDMATEIAGLPWACEVPLVVDRALGNAGWVEKLDTLDLRYITCVPAPELKSCGAPIPWDALREMQDCQNIEALRQKAAAAGFVRDGDRRYVCELGLFDKSRPRNTAARVSAAQFALEVLETIEAGTEKNDTLAAKLHISGRSLLRYKKLMALSNPVRERIHKGDADGLLVSQLLEISRLPAQRQDPMLNALVARASGRRCAQYKYGDPPPFRARAALSLNPKRFFEDREADQKRLAEIRSRVEGLNGRLASPRSHRKDSSALAEIERVIQRRSFGDVCSTSMKRTKDGREVVLHVNEDALQRRRQSDGIALVISHPDVSGTASERVARYFSKDAIEKDFQSIKSVLGLRPVRHKTDHKLRAHVSICVLALLLTRLIEHQLKGANAKQTLPAIIEQLEPIRISLIDNDGTRYYTITKHSRSVADLLAFLQRSDLVDNTAITEKITPR